MVHFSFSFFGRIAGNCFSLHQTVLDWGTNVHKHILDVIRMLVIVGVYVLCSYMYKLMGRGYIEEWLLRVHRHQAYFYIQLVNTWRRILSDQKQLDANSLQKQRLHYFLRCHSESHVCVQRWYFVSKLRPTGYFRRLWSILHNVEILVQMLLRIRSESNVGDKTCGTFQDCIRPPPLHNLASDRGLIFLLGLCVEIVQCESIYWCIKQ